MKNLLKKINVFGLALVLVGGMAIVSQSAFKSAVAPLYGYDPSHIYSPNTWYPLEGISEGEEEGNYLCDGVENVCTAEFSTTPNNATPPPSGAREGTFVIVQ